GHRPAGPLRLFGAYQNASVSRRDHVALFVADAVIVPAAPRTPDHEIVEIGAFAVDDLPAETTAATRRRIDEVLTGAAPAELW
ncbi:hypothetical protein J8J40_31655, partial [Mycobacterium tuberculosis]|nr:hypothetical protein [Mycobacterium tuberculosis]